METREDYMALLPIKGKELQKKGDKITYTLNGETKETTVTDVVICPTNNDARGQWVQRICANKLSYDDALRYVVELFGSKNYPVVLGVGYVTDDRGTLPGYDDIPHPMNKIFMTQDEGNRFNFV